MEHHLSSTFLLFFSLDCLYFPDLPMVRFQISNECVITGYLEVFLYLQLGCRNCTILIQIFHKMLPYQKKKKKCSKFRFDGNRSQTGQNKVQTFNIHYPVTTPSCTSNPLSPMYTRNILIIHYPLTTPSCTSNPLSPLYTRNILIIHSR